MALRAVPDHPKFARLKSILRQPKGSTLGWLEMMWHFAGRFTPHGDIGKYADADIETWVEWNGEPGALIAALLDARWLDHSEKYRLLVHDWPTHADKATKASVKRSRKSFCAPDGDTCVPVVDIPEPEVIAPGALPVPVPVPVPVPEPVPGAVVTTPPRRVIEPEPVISPEMIAQAVMTELRVAGRFTLTALDQVCRAEVGAGRDPTELRDEMVEAWREYLAAGWRIRYRKKPEQFFADGDWRDRTLWQWQEGQQPDRQVRTTGASALQKLQQQREAAL